MDPTLSILQEWGCLKNQNQNEEKKTRTNAGAEKFW
jgi:hypothetical protein